jgi:ElaB/YqjD/DUF883 family membrane-anchored ribosome-binding protein
MASMHEMQTTDTPRVDTPGHDKPQTLGAQMQHVGTQVKETMQDVGIQVKETVQAAGTQVKETVQHVGTQVKETMQDVGIQVKETMQAAGTQVYEQGRESFQDLNRTIEAQIRERPIQALLVAGGIGVLLGLLWRRS